MNINGISFAQAGVIRQFLLQAISNKLTSYYT